MRGRRRLSFAASAPPASLASAARQRQPQLGVRRARASGRRTRRQRAALLDEQDRDAARRGSGRASRTASRRRSARARATARRAAARRAGRRSARAIASCCCWPPESAPAWRFAKSATTGKSPRTQSRSSATPSCVRRPASPSRRFSSTVSEAKMWRPSGTSATPARATSSGPAAQRPAVQQDLAAPRAARRA